MDSKDKEKAIAQALASLNIDGINLKPEFIISFKEKNGLLNTKGPSLTLKRSVKDDKRKHYR